jgi:two-component system chemotaxis response regulator CheY
MAAAILVVDDDECTRELTYIHLSNAGYEVLLAEDAIVGGHFLLDRRVDLLITDIAMPYLDGLDLVRALRSDPVMSSLPVVFLAAEGGHEETATRLQATACLRKPVRRDELLAAVRKHV